MRVISMQKGGNVAEVWLDLLQPTLEEVQEEADDAAAKIRKSSTEYWNAWAEAAFASGSRGMHKASRLRTGGDPTTVKIGQQVTALPEAVLRKEADTLSSFWKS